MEVSKLAGAIAASATTIGVGVVPPAWATGKVYFDVVGDAPNNVIFNNGAEDILGWVMTPGISPAEVAPPASGDGGSDSGNSTGSGSGSGDEGSMGSTGPNAASPENTADGSSGADEGNADAAGQASSDGARG